MTDRSFVRALLRDCLTGLIVLASILAAIVAGYGLIVLLAAFFATPLVMAGWIVLAVIREPVA